MVTLYQKWLKLLTASEFAAVADLHHRTNNQFQAEIGRLHGEIGRLQDLQQQTYTQLERKKSTHLKTVTAGAKCFICIALLAHYTATALEFGVP